MDDDILDNVLTLPRARVGAAFSIFDADAEPALVPCECGELYPWVWWDPEVKFPGRGLRGRWAHPTVNPCPSCKPSDAFDDMAQLAHRQKVAGVPFRYRAFRLDRKGVQTRDETEEAFRNRIRHANGRKGASQVIGVTASLARTYRALLDYEPASGSLMLWGPPGTGKTLLMCALATRLLEQPPRQLVDLFAVGRLVEHDERRRDYMLKRGLNMAHVQRSAASSVRYITTEELADREALRWKGDPQPAAEVAEASVLFLDELWGEQKPTVAEVKGVKRVVEYRYQNGLPTVYASNTDPAQLLDDRACPYGARMADRFAETLQRGAGIHSLGGDSWRR